MVAGALDPARSPREPHRSLAGAVALWLHARAPSTAAGAVLMESCTRAPSGRVGGRRDEYDVADPTRW